MTVPKMTLGDQANYLHRLRERCRMHGPGAHQGKLAGSATVTLTSEDLETIERIRATLDLMNFHGADKFVRDRVARGGRSK